MAENGNVNEIARRFEKAKVQADAADLNGEKLSFSNVAGLLNASADFINYGLEGELWNPSGPIGEITSSLPPDGEILPYGTQISLNTLPNTAGDGGHLIVRFSKTEKDPKNNGCMLLEYSKSGDGSSDLKSYKFNSGEISLKSALDCVGKLGLAIASSRVNK